MRSWLRRVRLGVVFVADRLIVAAARPRRAVETFSVINAENPAAALRAELDARGFRVRAACVAIQRSLVTVKPLDLPPIADGEVEGMVRFEVERHLPFPTDDALVDFAAVPAEGNGRRVLLVASERRVVDRALRLLAEAKIRPLSITVASHDLASLLGRRPRNERTVWMHRVGKDADLLFLAGNTLAMSRSLPESDASAVAAEIRRSLGMLRWRHCDAVWISGDAAADYQASAAFDELGIPVGSPPISARAQRALGSPDGAAWLAAAVSTAPRAQCLNLLPLTLRPRRLSRSQFVKIALIVITAGLGLGSLFAHGVRNSRHLARLDGEIRQLGADVAAVERLRRDVERGRRMLDTVRAIDAAGLWVLPVLRELTDLLPSEAWLTTLSLDQKGIEMTGHAALASALIPLVENSPQFERAEFASPVTRGRDKEQFRIKAAWEAAPGAMTTGGSGPSSIRSPSGGQPSASVVTQAPASVPRELDATAGPSRPGVRPPTAPRAEGRPPAPLEPAPPAPRRSVP